MTGPYDASSTHPHCPTNKARINSTTGWCPGRSVDGQYLQVAFRTVSMLKAITTLGRVNADQWVIKYKVRTSMDGVTWTYVSNSTGDEMACRLCYNNI
ncbi:Retinoschisin [Mizuhopecten yessoensis]|uniref:Retinoschisin n=1 Tax=Mizuhopecten yessoensis TaxID=6573 RepID=A0A210QKF1_MIZYE|nr:Retinoschisin [Mizuhopecten yessoensis]